MGQQSMTQIPCVFVYSIRRQRMRHFFAKASILSVTSAVRVYSSEVWLSRVRHSTGAKQPSENMALLRNLHLVFEEQHMSLSQALSLASFRWETRCMYRYVQAWYNIISGKQMSL